MTLTDDTQALILALVIGLIIGVTAGGIMFAIGSTIRSPRSGL